MWMKMGPVLPTASNRFPAAPGGLSASGGKAPEAAGQRLDAAGSAQSRAAREGALSSDGDINPAACKKPLCLLRVVTLFWGSWGPLEEGRLGKMEGSQ